MAASFSIMHSTLLAVISLFNWPAQILQSSAGGFPSNYIECLTSHHQLTKTWNQLCLAYPTDKYSRQWSSSPPARSFTGSHICQSDLLSKVDYTVFVSWWCEVCFNLLLVCPISCELCPICHELRFPFVRPNMFCPNPPGPTGPIFWSPVDIATLWLTRPRGPSQWKPIALMVNWMFSVWWGD